GRPTPAPEPEPETTGNGGEPSASLGTRRRGDSARESLELFRELGSVEAVAARRALKASTIWSHMTDAVAHDELDGLAVSGLQPEEYECLLETLRLFAREGFLGLKPAHEALGEVYSYELLRLVWADIGRTANLE
ncbi:helix-turn-helix domain-containing protein, partial [Desulfocurvibacter africanus]|uniref:helix-turn-helix domain-containing protein n=1 Tax=Desulfocurvibacter africanus TaxID=873 RepID=UPI002FD9AE11